MPQLDRFAFISEYFWLFSTLFILYVMVTFYILPILLSNMMARRKAFSDLSKFILLSNTMSLLEMTPKYSDMLLLRKPFLFLFPSSFGKLVAKNGVMLEFILSLFNFKKLELQPFFQVMNLFFYRKYVFFYCFFLLSVTKNYAKNMKM